jgi:hypothetical protein
MWYVWIQEFVNLKYDINVEILTLSLDGIMTSNCLIFPFFYLYVLIFEFWFKHNVTVHMWQ